MIGWRRVLCGLIVMIGLMTRPAQLTTSGRYAVIGSEASSLLPLFVDTDSVMVVRVGDLTSVLTQASVSALIVPEEWSNTLDLQVAEASHLPVVRLKRHTSVTTIVSNIHSIAALVGEPTKGEQIARRLRSGLAAIRARYAGEPPIRVMILTPEGYTEGQGTLLTELINIAGGVNTAAEAGIPEARQISDAQIREFNPQVVLLLHWTAANVPDFAQNAAYKGIPAFDQGRITRIAPLGKYPAGLVNDVQQLAVILHR